MRNSATAFIAELNSLDSKNKYRSPNGKASSKSRSPLKSNNLQNSKYKLRGRQPNRNEDLNKANSPEHETIKDQLPKPDNYKQIRESSKKRSAQKSPGKQIGKEYSYRLTHTSSSGENMKTPDPERTYLSLSPFARKLRSFLGRSVDYPHSESEALNTIKPKSKKSVNNTKSLSSVEEGLSRSRKDSSRVLDEESKSQYNCSINSDRKARRTREDRNKNSHNDSTSSNNSRNEKNMTVSSSKKSLGDSNMLLDEFLVASRKSLLSQGELESSLPDQVLGKKPLETSYSKSSRQEGESDHLAQQIDQQNRSITSSLLQKKNNVRNSNPNLGNENSNTVVYHTQNLEFQNMLPQPDHIESFKKAKQPRKSSPFTKSFQQGELDLYTPHQARSLSSISKWQFTESEEENKKVASPAWKPQNKIDSGNNLELIGKEDANAFKDRNIDQSSTISDENMEGEYTWKEPEDHKSRDKLASYRTKHPKSENTEWKGSSITEFRVPSKSFSEQKTITQRDSHRNTEYLKDGNRRWNLYKLSNDMDVDDGPEYTEEGRENLQEDVEIERSDQQKDYQNQHNYPNEEDYSSQPSEYESEITIFNDYEKSGSVVSNSKTEISPRRNNKQRDQEELNKERKWKSSQENNGAEREEVKRQSHFIQRGQQGDNVSDDIAVNNRSKGIKNKIDRTEEDADQQPNRGMNKLSKTAPHNTVEYTNEIDREGYMNNETLIERLEHKSIPVAGKRARVYQDQLPKSHDLTFQNGDLFPLGEVEKAPETKSEYMSRNSLFMSEDTYHDDEVDSFLANERMADIAIKDKPKNKSMSKSEYLSLSKQKLSQKEAGSQISLNQQDSQKADTIGQINQDEQLLGRSPLEKASKQSIQDSRSDVESRASQVSMNAQSLESDVKCRSNFDRDFDYTNVKDDLKEKNKNSKNTRSNPRQKPEELDAEQREESLKGQDLESDLDSKVSNYETETGKNQRKNPSGDREKSSKGLRDNKKLEFESSDVVQNNKSLRGKELESDLESQVSGLSQGLQEKKKSVLINDGGQRSGVANKSPSRDPEGQEIQNDKVRSSTPKSQIRDSESQSSNQNESNAQSLQSDVESRASNLRKGAGTAEEQNMVSSEKKRGSALTGNNLHRPEQYIKRDSEIKVKTNPSDTEVSKVSKLSRETKTSIEELNAQELESDPESRSWNPAIEKANVRGSLNGNKDKYLRNNKSHQDVSNDQAQVSISHQDLESDSASNVRYESGNYRNQAIIIKKAYVSSSEAPSCNDVNNAHDLESDFESKALYERNIVHDKEDLIVEEARSSNKKAGPAGSKLTPIQNGGSSQQLKSANIRQESQSRSLIKDNESQSSGSTNTNKAQSLESDMESIVSREEVVYERKSLVEGKKKTLNHNNIREELVSRSSQYIQSQEPTNIQRSEIDNNLGVIQSVVKNTEIVHEVKKNPSLKEAQGQESEFESHVSEHANAHDIESDVESRVSHFQTEAGAGGKRSQERTPPRQNQRSSSKSAYSSQNQERRDQQDSKRSDVSNNSKRINNEVTVRNKTPEDNKNSDSEYQSQSEGNAQRLESDIESRTSNFKDRAESVKRNMVAGTRNSLSRTPTREKSVSKSHRHSQVQDKISPRSLNSDNASNVEKETKTANQVTGRQVIPTNSNRSQKSEYSSSQGRGNNAQDLESDSEVRRSSPSKKPLSSKRSTFAEDKIKLSENNIIKKSPRALSSNNSQVRMSHQDLDSDSISNFDKQNRNMTGNVIIQRRSFRINNLNQESDSQALRSHSHIPGHNNAEDLESDIESKLPTFGRGSNLQQVTYLSQAKSEKSSIRKGSQSQNYDLQSDCLSQKDDQLVSKASESDLDSLEPNNQGSKRDFRFNKQDHIAYNKCNTENIIRGEESLNMIPQAKSEYLSRSQINIDDREQRNEAVGEFIRNQKSQKTSSISGQTKNGTQKNFAQESNSQKPWSTFSSQKEDQINYSSQNCVSDADSLGLEYNKPKKGDVKRDEKVGKVQSKSYFAEEETLSRGRKSIQGSKEEDIYQSRDQPDEIVYERDVQRHDIVLEKVKKNQPHKLNKARRPSDCDDESIFTDNKQEQNGNEGHKSSDVEGNDNRPSEEKLYGEKNQVSRGSQLQSQIKDRLVRSDDVSAPDSLEDLSKKMDPKLEQLLFQGIQILNNKNLLAKEKERMDSEADEQQERVLRNKDDTEAQPRTKHEWSLISESNIRKESNISDADSLNVPFTPYKTSNERIISQSESRDYVLGELEGRDPKENLKKTTKSDLEPMNNLQGGRDRSSMSFQDPKDSMRNRPDEQRLARNTENDRVTDSDNNISQSQNESNVEYSESKLGENNSVDESNCTKNDGSTANKKTRRSQKDRIRGNKPAKIPFGSRDKGIEGSNIEAPSSPRIEDELKTQNGQSAGVTSNLSSKNEKEARQQGEALFVEREYNEGMEAQKDIPRSRQGREKKVKTVRIDDSPGNVSDNSGQMIKRSKSIYEEEDLSWVHISKLLKVQTKAAIKLQRFVRSKLKVAQKIETEEEEGPLKLKDFKLFVKNMKKNENAIKGIKSKFKSEGQKDEVMGLMVAFLSSYCTMENSKSPKKR